MPPTWVLFDLNGTVLDTGSVAGPLGGDRELVDGAFQEALLHTMADTLSGAPYRPLPDYLRATLERRLLAAGRTTDGLDAAMDRAAAMDPFPEAEQALTTLRDGGGSTGTLTNSGTRAPESAPQQARPRSTRRPDRDVAPSWQLDRVTRRPQLTHREHGPQHDLHLEHREARAQTAAPAAAERDPRVRAGRLLEEALRPERVRV